MLLIKNFSEEQLIPRSDYKFTMKCFMTLLAWCFLVIALMDPVTITPNQSTISNTSERLESDIIFIVDTSASMGAVDLGATDSRLKKALSIIDELIKDSSYKKVALYTLSSEITKLVPFTYDKLFIRLMSQNIVVGESFLFGTDFETSFSELLSELPPQNFFNKFNVVFLTDGGDTKWEIADENGKRLRENTLIQTLLPLKEQLLFVGIGGNTPIQLSGITYQNNPVSTKLNRELLEKLANGLHGALILGDKKNSSVISRDIEVNLQKNKMKINIETSLQVDHYFQIPLLVATLLLLLVFTMSDARQLIPFFLFPVALFGEVGISNQAYYMEKAGLLEEAKSHYIEALEQTEFLFEEQIILYNLGTILLKEKKYEEALFYFFVAQGENSAPYLAVPLKENSSFALTKIESLPKTEEEAVTLGSEAAGKLLEKKNLLTHEEALLVLKEIIKDVITLEEWLKAYAYLHVQGFSKLPILEKAFSEKLDQLKKMEKTFIAKLIGWEKRKFQDNFCVKEPWGKALSLFEEGSEALASLPPLQRKAFFHLRENLEFAQKRFLEVFQLLKEASSSEEQKNQETTPMKFVEMYFQDAEETVSPTFKSGEEMPW